MVIIDVNPVTSGKIVYVNEETTVLFGYSSEELVDQNVKQIMPILIA